MARLERLSIARQTDAARVARGIQHGHNDDRADLVTKQLRRTARPGTGRSQPSLGTHFVLLAFH